MDELFEALTLIQTHKIKDFPIVLMGKEYYYELYDFLEEMVRQKKGPGPRNPQVLLVTTRPTRSLLNGRSARRSLGVCRQPQRLRSRCGLDESCIARR